MFNTIRPLKTFQNKYNLNFQVVEFLARMCRSRLTGGGGGGSSGGGRVASSSSNTLAVPSYTLPALDSSFSSKAAQKY